MQPLIVLCSFSFMLFIINLRVLLGMLPDLLLISSQSFWYGSSGRVLSYGRSAVCFFVLLSVPLSSLRIANLSYNFVLISVI